MAVEQPLMNGEVEGAAVAGASSQFPQQKRSFYIVRVPRPTFAGEAALQERQENFNRLLAKVKAFRGDPNQGAARTDAQEGSEAGAGAQGNGVTKGKQKSVRRPGMRCG